MTSSVIVKLRKVLALTRIFEFGRALHPCFSGTIHDGTRSAPTAAANTIPVTGERECLCDPQLRTEATIRTEKAPASWQEKGFQDELFVMLNSAAKIIHSLNRSRWFDNTGAEGCCDSPALSVTSLVWAHVDLAERRRHFLLADSVARLVVRRPATSAKQLTDTSFFETLRLPSGRWWRGFPSPVRLGVSGPLSRLSLFGHHPGEGILKIFENGVVDQWPF